MDRGQAQVRVEVRNEGVVDSPPVTIFLTSEWSELYDCSGFLSIWNSSSVLYSFPAQCATIGGNVTIEVKGIPKRGHVLLNVRAKVGGEGGRYSVEVGGGLGILPGLLTSREMGETREREEGDVVLKAVMPTIVGAVVVAVAVFSGIRFFRKHNSRLMAKTPPQIIIVTESEPAQKLPSLRKSQVEFEYSRNIFEESLPT